LYDHIFPDETEIKTRLNQHQTIIEVCLCKQTHTTWPQLYSRLSTPITPEQKDINDNQIDQHIYSTIEDEKTYELPIKKTYYRFSETVDGKAIVHITLAEVQNCEVQFTETNFTVNFFSKFANSSLIDISFVSLPI
jgi:alpha-glucosidase (family GH31 glycosyl hydrolase)